MLTILIEYNCKDYKGLVPANMSLENYLEKLKFMYPNFDVVQVFDSDTKKDVWPELQKATKLPDKLPSPLVPSKSKFKFKLDGGKLIYNFTSERLEVLEEDGNTISLHCGDLIDIYLNGKWETYRVEMGASWCIVDLFDEYQIPENLLVKYAGRGH